MPSIKCPPRNGDGSFLADTSSLLQIGRDMDFGGLEGGWAGEEEKTRESRMGGKERETSGESKTGIRNFLKGSHLISWLTWLRLSPGWEWNV